MNGRRSWSRCDLSLALAVSWTAAFSGCGTSAGTPTSASPDVSRGATPAERFFPLEEGKIYHYVTRDGDETGMLIAKVHRADAAHGELHLSNATKRFAILPDGIAYVGGAYILKSTLEVGSSWPGEHGGSTRVEAVDAAVDVPAGHYAGCLRTVEQGGREVPASYETTYCPGIGVVLLVVRASGTVARAELKSYGLPVKIE